jgi:hypothetical protein
LDFRHGSFLAYEHDAREHAMTEDHTVAARSRTLEGFAADPGCEEGVSIGELEPGTLVTVETRNSRYQMVVLDSESHRVLLNGGALFPDRTEVVVRGSTTGGSAIKLGWIGVGLRLELVLGRRRITTSRVQSVAVRRLLDEKLPLIA